MRQLTLLTICALTLTACAPTEGEVTNTSYRPGWTETTIRCDPAQPARCTPRVEHYSQTYRLRLDNGTDTGWRTVTEHDYQQCPTGAHYPDCTQAGAGSHHPPVTPTPTQAGR